MFSESSCPRAFACLLCLVLSLGVLTGCAVVNEGAVNYRKSAAAGKAAKTGELLELVKKYDFTEPANSGFFVSADETVSIHLSQAFIKDFFELANPLKFESGSNKRGEIAIVVNAYPLTGSGMAFGPEGFNGGRLVYYGDDVRKGQYLNFSYLPVYGPTPYTGTPIALQIYVIEMDTSGAKVKPLLGTLAKLGSVAYPPASPVLSVLDKLGSALLSQHTDDILLRYYMTLYPTQNPAIPGYPALQTGDYVLMRRENRNEGPPQQGEGPRFDWDSVRFDRLEGRLVMADNPAQCFTGETYLVFQIQKGFPALGAGQPTTFGAFRTALETAAEQSGEALAKSLTEATDEIVRQNTFHRLQRMGKELVRYVYTDDASITYMASGYVTELGEQTRKNAAAAASSASAGSGEKQEDAATKNITIKEIGVLTDAQIEYLLAVLKGLLTTQHQDLKAFIQAKGNHKTLIDDIVKTKQTKDRTDGQTSGT